MSHVGDCFNLYKSQADRFETYTWFSYTFNPPAPHFSQQHQDQVSCNYILFLIWVLLIIVASFCFVVKQLDVSTRENTLEKALDYLYYFAYSVSFTRRKTYFFLYTVYTKNQHTKFSLKRKECRKFCRFPAHNLPTCLLM